MSHLNVLDGPDYSREYLYECCQQAYAEIDRLRTELELWKDRANRGRAILAEHHPAMEDAAAQISRLSADKAKLREALNDLLNDCINFDGGKLTIVFQERATAVLAETTEAVYE